MKNNMENDMGTGFALVLIGIILNKHRSCFEFEAPSYSEDTRNLRLHYW